MNAGLAGGLAFGLAIGSGPAFRLAVMERTWQFRRVRFLPLLQTALDRQVLRQTGAVYQFRHAALQDLLATREPATSQPAPSAPRTAQASTSPP
jgi:hypothetical protein